MGTMFIIACCLGGAMFLGHIYLERHNKSWCETCQAWTKSMYLMVVEADSVAPLYADRWCGKCHFLY